MKLQRFLLTLAAIAGFGLAQAQTSNTKMKAGKKLDSTQMATWATAKALKNQQYVGMKYPPFSATAFDGVVWNNDMLKDKVTLMFFWYPSCNCFNWQKLAEVYEQFKSNPAVQILVVNFENAGLSEAIDKNKLPYQFLTVPGIADAQKMNFNNGFPSFVVTNKAGIITKINGGLEGFKPQQVQDLIKGLL